MRARTRRRAAACWSPTFGRRDAADGRRAAQAACARACPSTWCRRPSCRCRRLPLHAERQGRPQGPAGARSAGRRAGAPRARRARGLEQTIAGDLARGAGARAGRASTTTSSTSAATRCCSSRCTRACASALGPRGPGRRPVPLPDRRARWRATWRDRPEQAETPRRPRHAAWPRAAAQGDGRPERDRHRRHGRPLPGRRGRRGVLAQPARRRRVDRAASATRSCAAAGVARALLRRPALRQGAAACSTASSCSTPLLRLSARARPRSWTRSSASSWSAPGRRWSTPATTRERYAGADRRLRRRRASNTLPAATCSRNPELVAAGRRLPGRASATTRTSWPPASSYKLNLRGPERHRADRLLDLAGRGPPGLPEPARPASATWRWPAASSITSPQTAGYLYQEGGILSPDGHCRAFDAAARGTVFGNGVGRRGAQAAGRRARATATPIHAVIHGSAINNDGAPRSASPRPSVDGQAEVIAAALGARRRRPGHDQLRRGARHRHAARRPDRGRRADPGVPRRHGRAAGFCAIGSVKTNIGHLDAAAGVAG